MVVRPSTNELFSEISEAISNHHVQTQNAEQPYHHNEHEEHALVAIRVEKCTWHFVANLGQKLSVPVKNDRQEDVDRPCPKEGQCAGQAFVFGLAVSSPPVEVVLVGTSPTDHSGKRRQHNPDEQECWRKVGDEEKVVGLPARQPAIRDGKQSANYKVNN